MTDFFEWIEIIIDNNNYVFIRIIIVIAAHQSQYLALMHLHPPL